MTRTTSVFLLACAAAFACDESGEGDTPEEGASAEGASAMERAAKKVEEVGEALREKSADGSLLVQSPMTPDAGDSAP